MSVAEVAVVKTTPATVLRDYARVMRLVGYQQYLPREPRLLLKLNLSWTRFFPACSTPPWQLDGVLRTLLEDGYPPEKLVAVENKTVVTDPHKGARLNRWLPVLEQCRVPFVALPEVEWHVYPFRSPLLRLPRLFPEGIEIPRMYPGTNVLHLPTLKTHGHSVTTGAIKNAFGGLLREVRHYAHKYIHEVLVDLVLLERELHAGRFAVMDGTVCGDGAGPRTMVPQIKNYILASGDSVALDAVAAKMMGFAPLQIPYLRMCHERGLGVADPDRIQVRGEDIRGVHFGFTSKRSLVIYGDQAIRLGWLQPLEKFLLHSPARLWAPLASTLYHDVFWYPCIGFWRVQRFLRSEWGRLWQSYAQTPPPLPQAELATPPSSSR